MPRTRGRGEINMHASTSEASACAHRYACVACAARRRHSVKASPARGRRHPSLLLWCEATRTRTRNEKERAANQRGAAVT